MSSALASCAAHAFGATAGERTSSSSLNLKRPRGVVAPVIRGKMARGPVPARGVGAEDEYSALKHKRAVCGFDVKIVAAQPPRHHKERMEAAAPACKDGARIFLASKRRPEAPSAEEIAKRRKNTSSLKPAAPQAAHRRAAEPCKQQQRATTPATTQRPLAGLIDKAQEVLRRRRLEEIARAREKFRLELLEVEKSAMPDETIYSEDLEELGLTALQYAVTPTRKQAQRRTGCQPPRHRNMLFVGLLA